MCGDRIEVLVKYAPDGTIADTGFEARGCAISVASADLMAETVSAAARLTRMRCSMHFASWHAPANVRNATPHWPNRWNAWSRWRACTNTHHG